MGDNGKFFGYHSTSTVNASSILYNGFKLPKLDEPPSKKDVNRFLKYWLGVGVYFFEDEEAAKWWSEKPSNTFGTVGEHLVLKSEINPKNVLDLRKVSTWRQLIIIFDQFIELMGKKFKVKFKNKHEAKAYIRCIFFEFLKNATNADMIIAAFNQEEFEYLGKGIYSIEKQMDIYFTEVQYCVYDPKIIAKTERF